MTDFIIDSHCHLDMPDFDKDRQQVLKNARKAGVHGFVIPGTTAGRWNKVLKIARNAEDIWPALGLHPYYCNDHTETELEQLAAQIAREPPVAIGEIGLDLFLPQLDEAKQRFYLEAQLDMAREFDLPVILHIRKANDPMLQLLRNHPVKGGICHAFSGSLQHAHKFIDMGFCLGFGGMLTYERSRKLRQLAKNLPLTALLLETDAPDMSGEKHRYQRNSPEYLPEVLDVLEKLRAESRERIAHQTTLNLQQLLGLEIPGFH
ncbi:TatD family hydrolase [Thiolapillus brandeum]|uniref:TatD DNase family protein n=1 Tax=Thiolapillus brandeum TaxID=1076588 RepID=A0A7U6GJ80_9GAMM|nr:TatD family hydrolase [Thiolapillus brandeum]BAO44570.1 TatD DNase family protein [Thiolapillus brandeum]